jgi:L-arabinose isomerase
MATAKIGLLPLYLKLYDDLDKGQWRPHIDEFPRTIAAELKKRGLQVVSAPVCRIKREFAAAVKKLEAEKVDALVTLHLAYSPSLESSEVLASTQLPLLVLDTTPAYSYAPSQDPDELMYNHGIHGVQDMCNLLLRNGKPFLIEAGHWQRSDVLDRIAALAVPARMAAVIRRATVGIMGTPFKGMGDFNVTPARIRTTIGAAVKSLAPEKLTSLLAGVKEKDVAAEVAEDLRRFAPDGVSPEAHARSVKLGLAVRGWIEQEGLSAISFNFQYMKKKVGYITAPFLEMSKAMERGIGYAGEGDTLTALLVAALLSGIPDTSFTEMFCPDWENDTLFLSHMGEVNWRLLDGMPQLREMEYTYSPTDNPALVVGRFRAGEIALVNLAPVRGGGYRLIVAPASMLPVHGADRMREGVRGWFKPALSVPDFLEEYSRLGGTHHLAVSYTRDTKPIETFGKLMGWDVVVIA